MHDDFTRRHDVTPGSDRSFGLVIAAACLLVALAPWRHGQPARWWAIVAGAACGAFALTWPRALRPLNVAWTHLGVLLSRVTSPVLLGFVYYAVIVPTGMVMRFIARDPLRRARDPKAASYWITRDPASPPSSMTQQF